MGACQGLIMQLLIQSGLYDVSMLLLGWLLTCSSQKCPPRIAIIFWSLNMAFDHKLW